MSKNKTHYRRILLKLSGEALMGKENYGISTPMIERIAREIKDVYDIGIQISIVVGGGNIFRGIRGSEQGIDRTTADHMGMLATVMNALSLQSALENIDVPTRVQSAISISSVCEPYLRRRAIRHMEKGRIVIFSSGIGNPFFTTDTAAALRSIEMGCDVLLKGTQVDGVYTKDPKSSHDAQRYDRLSYQDVLSKDLKVMDTSAISLSRDNHLPILVFSIHTPGAFMEVIKGQGTFTVID